MAARGRERVPVMQKTFPDISCGGSWCGLSGRMTWRAVADATYYITEVANTTSWDRFFAAMVTPRVLRVSLGF